MVGETHLTTVFSGRHLDLGRNAELTSRRRTSPLARSLLVISLAISAVWGDRES